LGAVAKLFGAVVKYLGAVVKLFGAVVKLLGAVVELLGAVANHWGAVVELFGAAAKLFGVVVELPGAAAKRLGGSEKKCIFNLPVPFFSFFFPRCTITYTPCPVIEHLCGGRRTASRGQCNPPYGLIK